MHVGEYKFFKHVELQCLDIYEANIIPFYFILKLLTITFDSCIFATFFPSKNSKKSSILIA